MASTSVSSVSGIKAVLYPIGVKFINLTVLKFRYEEELGQPFKIEIELECTSTDPGTLSPNTVVGQTLLVTISKDGKEIRYFHAIMETFVAVDNGGAFNHYHGTAVPWYSLLKLAENSKIYPNTNARKLVTEIHKDFGFPSGCTWKHKDEDTSPSSQWTVRTQYRETYFHFLQRSLQQEGIYYYWTHTADGHVMNTTDGTASAPPFRKDPIPYNPSAGVTTECIYEWSHNAVLQPQHTVLNDYDCLNSQPAAESSLLVKYNSIYSGSVSAGYFKNDAPYNKLGVFRHPGSYSTRGAPQTPEAGSGRWYAQRLMQAFECRQAFVRGKARCVGISAGHKFTVSWDPKNNPYSAAPYPSAEGDYLTTKMTLEIGLRTSGPHPSLDCTFEAIPVNNTIKYRPNCNVPAPRVYGVQSAIVCRLENAPPQGSPPPPVSDTRDNDDWQHDTIPHCDVENGVARVQVKFHWCRGKTERTDWIRLTHLMAGNGWGEFHLPRPGDEVLVAFEHGDPDRPVIVGCLYNNTHKMPFDLSDPKEGVGDKLKKLFAIKDPGGNLFIMDPGTETDPEDPKAAKGQTISLYSPSTEHPSSVQIGHNDENWPGKPHH